MTIVCSGNGQVSGVGFYGTLNCPGGKTCPKPSIGLQLRSCTIVMVSHAKREWFEFTVRQLSLVLMQSLMGETPCSEAASLINKFYPFYA
ncbi:hypothetical protein [Moorena producens]|uniref:hypothetical protein n=1 Tax=Moorena producens TaxID=1155739 RepID=UPI003C72BFB0